MNTNVYRRAAEWYKTRFGGRVQKIAIDAGFSCPNRDGTLSTAGCTYCNNDSFSPFYSNPFLSITEQLSAGAKFCQKRYQCQRFFAYFQSYSCTYAPLEILKQKYAEASDFKGVEGLIIATRPDCLTEEIVTLLQEISKKTYLRIELGVESFDDRVLAAVNRCHSAETAKNAIITMRKKGIDVSAHLIFGLPDESYDCAVTTAREIANSGANFVKLHHLQIVKNSRLANIIATDPQSIKLHTINSYLDAVAAFITHLPDEVAIERLINRVPPDQLIAPVWNNIDESSFQRLLIEKLKKQNLYQGAKFSKDC